MRILQLIQKPQLRGAEVFACQLSTGLNALGHESIIVPIFDGNAYLPFGGKILPLKADANRRFTDFKGWKQLANFVKEYKPDIVQANAGDTLKYAACSKMLYRWKAPVVFRNASTISLYIKTAAVKQLNKLFLNHVAHVASVSNISREDFLNIYPEFSGRITTLPIGIDPVNLPEKQRNSYPVLIHVGGFTYEKNHKGLINIFEQVLKQIPTCVLWLVGDGPLRTELQTYVQERKLEKNVIFYGFRSDVMQLIHQADMLLLPSIIEGLPGVILEAFYCKTPVMAYDVGGIKEVVSDRTGVLVKLHEEEKFASAVCNLMGNADVKKEMTDAAYKIVTSQYMNEAIAKRFLAVYKAISE